jgi:hypothetical protein
VNDDRISRAEVSVAAVLEKRDLDALMKSFTSNDPEAAASEAKAQQHFVDDLAALPIDRARR